ncbi:hypothetical protein, partial [Xanthomonas cannabis]|uniref:hypothetical protein n=1 Tax=Xanthomonas cannabis TaxID=1885674 RepID=UPI00194EDEA3
ATVGGQGPVEMVGLHGFQQRLANCDAVSLLFNKTARLFNKTASHFLAWCPHRLRDRVAAWMPLSRLYGRTGGVSRERWGHRALDQI